MSEAIIKFEIPEFIGETGKIKKTSENGEIKIEVYEDLANLINKSIYEKENDNDEDVTVGFRVEDRVPDEWRYIIKCEKENDETHLKITKKESLIDKVNLDESLSIFNTEENRDKNIVIIIESPHSGEYLYHYKKMVNGYFPYDLEPIRPLNSNGYNGLKLKTIPQFFFESNLGEGIYNIIICNPIQYQTSLHFYTLKGIDENIRNAVWNGIWEKEKIKNYFKKRIGLYNPKIVINACTYGHKKNIIHDFIKEINDVRDENKKYNIYKCYHPSDTKNDIDPITDEINWR